MSLTSEEEYLLQACLTLARQDGLPSREQALSSEQIERLALAGAIKRFPYTADIPDATIEALQDIYMTVYRVTATPAGQWPLTEKEEKQ